MAERSGRDLAEVLLRKAQGDEATIVSLLDDDDVPDEVVGFHAQQAVEKSLKAVLASNQIDYAYSHDLAYLADLLVSNGIDVPEKVREGEELRPWAAEFRYEDPVGGPGLDRKHAHGLARAATQWAAGALRPGESERSEESNDQPSA